MRDGDDGYTGIVYITPGGRMSLFRGAYIDGDPGVVRWCLVRKRNGKYTAYPTASFEFHPQSRFSYFLMRILMIDIPCGRLPKKPPA